VRPMIVLAHARSLIRHSGFAEVNASQANDPLAMVTWAQKYDPTIVGGLRMANLVQQSFENAYASVPCHPLVS
jgi:hypothetical protein